MNIHEAIRVIYEGHDVSLPEWGGYWTKGENGLIKVVSKDAKVSYTPWLDKYYNRNDFYIKKNLGNKYVTSSCDEFLRDQDSVDHDRIEASIVNSLKCLSELPGKYLDNFIVETSYSKTVLELSGSRRKIVITDKDSSIYLNGIIVIIDKELEIKEYMNKIHDILFYYNITMMDELVSTLDFK